MGNRFTSWRTRTHEENQEPIAGPQASPVPPTRGKRRTRGNRDIPGCNRQQPASLAAARHDAGPRLPGPELWAAVLAGRAVRWRGDAPDLPAAAGGGDDARGLPPARRYGECRSSSAGPQRDLRKVRWQRKRLWCALPRLPRVRTGPHRGRPPRCQAGLRDVRDLTVSGTVVHECTTGEQAKARKQSVAKE